LRLSRLNAYLLALNLYLLYVVDEAELLFVEQPDVAPYILIMRDNKGMSGFSSEETYRLHACTKDEFNSYKKAYSQKQVGCYQPGLLVYLAANTIADARMDEPLRVSSEDTFPVVIGGEPSSRREATNRISQECRRLNERLTYYRNMRLFEPYFHIVGQNDPVADDRDIGSKGYGIAEVSILGMRVFPISKERTGWCWQNTVFPYDFVIRLCGDESPYAVHGECIHLYRDNAHVYGLPDTLMKERKVLVDEFINQTKKRNRTVTNNALFHYRTWEPNRKEQESSHGEQDDEHLRIIGGRTWYYDHVATNLSLRRTLPSDRQHAVWEAIGPTFDRARQLAANPLTINCLLYLSADDEIAVGVQPNFGPAKREYCTTVSRLVQLSEASPHWSPLIDTDEMMYLGTKYEMKSPLIASMDNLVRQMFVEELGDSVGRALDEILYFGLIEGYEAGDHVLLVQAHTQLSKAEVMRSARERSLTDTTSDIAFVPAKREAVLDFLWKPALEHRRPFLYVSLAMFLQYQYGVGSLGEAGMSTEKRI